MSTNDGLVLRLEKMRSARLIPPHSCPKIQKVANELRERTDYRSHYRPKVVSMGPIHHGISELQIGEHCKLSWAQKFVESTGESSIDLYQKIEHNLGELKTHFADNVLTMDIDTIGNFRSSDEKLAWMLFVDGCSLLYILDIHNDFETEETIMKLVSRDVLLLENQLPFMLLRLLAGDPLNLIERVDKFLEFYHVANAAIKNICSLDVETPHLLDLLRKTFFIWDKFECRDAVGIEMGSSLSNSILSYMNIQELISNGIKIKSRKSSRREPISNSVVRYMNIQELKSNGIRIKSSKSSNIHVSFSHRWLIGELTLPEIVLDDMTISVFLNLIAYEMCPDFKNDYGISTLLAFINSLIRLPEDVKDLRLAGVLFSNYGTDEELIKLFHFITTDVVSNTNSYSDVSREINKHMANKWKNNTVRFLRNIRHPWTNFAVHSAELALAFTVIQTWFAVHPAKS